MIAHTHTHGGDAASGIRARLSPREFDVFVGLACGTSGIDLAAQLRIQPVSVATYRRRIYRKLRIRSIAELTLAAQAAGLVRMRETP